MDNDKSSADSPEQARGQLPPRPFPWVTFLLVLTTVAAFIWQLIVLHRTGRDRVGDMLAFSPEALREHRYWTLLSYAWAHAVAMFGESSFFWLHIVANMVPLVCLGPAMEEILGRWKFLGLYLGGAIASALVWFIFHQHDEEPIIGASGAVFALIGGIAAAEPTARAMVLVLGIIPVHARIGVIALVICGIEVVQLIAAHIPLLVRFSMPEVAHVAHLGGAAFGALYVWLLLPPYPNDLTHCKTPN